MQPQSRSSFHQHLLLLLLSLSLLWLSLHGARPVAAVASATPSLELASVAQDGGPALRGAGGTAPAISADGRFVAFVSDAQDFAAATPGVANIFVRDRLNGTLELISQSTGGTAADRDSYWPAISADGRFVAFSTSATNLVSGSHPCGSVVVRDRLLNTTTELANRLQYTVPDGINFCDGESRVSLSDDGEWLAFSSSQALVPEDGNQASDIFLYQRSTSAVTLVSLSNTGDQSATGCYDPTLSSDGRYVTFVSDASNLVANDTNGYSDVFIRDRVNNTTERVSVSSTGAEGNYYSYGTAALSADGRFVTFGSIAWNLDPAAGDVSGEQVYLRDRATHTTECVSVTPAGSPAFPGSNLASISADGRYVAFSSSAPDLVAGDSNGATDVFIRDRATYTTTRLSVRSSGEEATGQSEAPVRTTRVSLTPNGRIVVFDSDLRTLVDDDQNGRTDVFMRDRLAAVTERISVRSDLKEGTTGAHCWGAAQSSEGRYITFASDAVNLVPNDTNGYSDVFVRDRWLGVTERVSVGPSGTEANSGSVFDANDWPDWIQTDSPAISADGRFVAFASSASNLVPNDNNRVRDIFVHDRAQGTTELVSPSFGQSWFSLDRRYPAISGDGRFVAFWSGSADLTVDDTNRTEDVFVRDRLRRVTERVSVGTQAGGKCDGRPAISADGRYVAFASYATDLVAGDTNDSGDVFVRDRESAATQRVSLAADGSQHAGWSTSRYGPIGMSMDGSSVSFLTGGIDGDPRTGGFVRDWVHGTTERVTRLADGSVAATPAYPRAPVLDANGLHVAFHGSEISTGYPARVMLRDRGVPNTQVLSTKPGGAPTSTSSEPHLSISADGHSVAFTSASQELLGTSQVGGWGVYVWDANNRHIGAGDLHGIRRSGGSVLLNWTDRSTGETGFQIERSTNGGRQFQIIATTNANIQSYEDLSAGENSSVIYRVIAVGTSVSAGYSNWAVVSPPPPPPVVPDTFRATAVSPYAVQLTWVDRSPDEDGFRLERQTGAGAAVPLAEVGADVVAYLDTTAAPNTTYTYQIRAFNTGGVSVQAAEANATTLPLPPSAPSGFAATAESQTEVQLSWTDTSDNEQGFIVKRAVGSGEYQALTTVGPDTEAYTDGSAAANTTYRYVLRAYNAGGQSTAVETTATTLPNPPASPSNLTASIRSLTSVRLNWNDGSSDETGFRVERRTGTGEYATLLTVHAGVTEYVDSAVIADTAYQYRVVAFNDGGDSMPSNEVSVQVQAGGKLQITPARLNFGTLKRGKVKQLKLTLKNEGKVAIAGEIGTLTSPFRIVDGGGAFTLEPKKSRKVVVEFAPSAAGLSSRTLQVTSTSVKSMDRAVSVSGRGK